MALHVDKETAQVYAASDTVPSIIGGIPIRMLSQAAARRNVTLVIREADLEKALVRLHERFFGVPA